MRQSFVIPDTNLVLVLFVAWGGGKRITDCHRVEVQIFLRPKVPRRGDNVGNIGGLTVVELLSVARYRVHRHLEAIILHDRDGFAGLSRGHFAKRIRIRLREAVEARD